jgi:hypothetical protein
MWVITSESAQNNLLGSPNYVEMCEIKGEIKKNKEFIDAVVISGGEEVIYF